MAKKANALFILAACVLISTACVTWGRKDLKTLKEPLPEEKAVLSVVKNDGQVIEFTKRNPGRVRGYTIVGVAKNAEMREIEISGPFSSIRQESYGRIIEVVDGKGQGWVVKSVIRTEEGRMTILGVESNQLTIPLSEVSTVRIRQDKTLPIAAILIGVIILIPVIWSLISVATI